MSIDLSKVAHELERMNQGEIQFYLKYLEELIEYTGEIENVELSLTCDKCQSPAEFVYCSECISLQDSVCATCSGLGGWFECKICDNKK